jgi:hypothetical protein
MQLVIGLHLRLFKEAAGKALLSPRLGRPRVCASLPGVSLNNPSCPEPAFQGEPSSQKVLSALQICSLVKCKEVLFSPLGCKPLKVGLFFLL